MMKPLALFSPAESRDRNGAITLSPQGSARLVNGQHGQAWELLRDTTNYITNPRFVALSGWFNGNSTRVVDSAMTHEGIPSLKSTITSVASTPYTFSYSASGSAVAGEPVNASVKARGSRAGIQVSWQLRFRDSANALIGNTMYGPKFTVSTTDWTDVTFENVVAPTGADSVQCLIRFEVNTVQVNDVVWVCKPQLERGTYLDHVTPYTDGDLGTGHAWTGTANASPSTRTDGYIIVGNPDLYVRPQQGTMLARFRKTVNTDFNNYIVWIGDYGSDDWTMFNTSGMTLYTAWRAGTAASTSNWPRPPLTLNAYQVAGQRWHDTTFETTLGGSGWDTASRDAPVGTFGTAFTLGGQGVLALNGELESLIIFEDVLTDEEAAYLVNLEGAWTWDMLQPRSAPAITPMSVTSAVLTPRLFKADRYNVLGEDITEYVRNGQVEYNPDRAIKMTFSADIDSGSLINPYTDFLAPFLTVEYDNGETRTSQMGLYAVVPPRQTISQQSRRVTIDGRDLTWILSVDVFENGYSIAAGTNIVSAVETILASAGFTRYAIQQSARTLTNTTSWKAGTTKLQVINDLLTGSGYYSLYCLKDGRFSSMPYRTNVNPTIAVTYDSDVHSYVQVVNQITLDTTPDRIANKVVVIKDNANEDPIVVTKINNSPMSPTSTVNLGMTIAKVFTDSQIVDAEAAEIRATQILEEASMQYNKLTLATFPDVEREPTNEVYSLNIKDTEGNVVVDGIWRCRGWRIGFTPNQMMTHDLSNISDPPREF